MIQEVFNEPELGCPVLWRFDGAATVDGQDCVAYDEYQWVPGRQLRHLISVVYAPFEAIDRGDSCQALNDQIGRFRDRALTDPFF